MNKNRLLQQVSRGRVKYTASGFVVVASVVVVAIGVLVVGVLVLLLLSPPFQSNSSSFRRSLADISLSQLRRALRESEPDELNGASERRSGMALLARPSSKEMRLNDCTTTFGSIIFISPPPSAARPSQRLGPAAPPLPPPPPLPAHATRSGASPAVGCDLDGRPALGCALGSLGADETVGSRSLGRGLGTDTPTGLRIASADEAPRTHTLRHDSPVSRLDDKATLKAAC